VAILQAYGEQGMGAVIPSTQRKRKSQDVIPLNIAHFTGVRRAWKGVVIPSASTQSKKSHDI
jgi:hypothetical protein